MMITHGRGEKQARRACSARAWRQTRRSPPARSPPGWVGGDGAGVFPPHGGCTGAQPPCYHLPGRLLLFFNYRYYFLLLQLRSAWFSRLRVPRPEAPWGSPAPGLCLPQSKRDGKLAAGFPVILGNFRWIRAARCLPRSAMVVPALCTRSFSSSLLLGHEPTNEMSWVVSARCPTVGAVRDNALFF